MKFVLRLAAALGAIASTGAAFAADLPVKAPPLASTVYNWTGIYAGVHVGYGVGMKDWINSSFDYDVKGFLGGGQIGINQQIGNWVIGIEADGSWSRIDGGQDINLGGPAVGFASAGSANTTIDSIFTLAGRIGFAQDRWLVYAKVGAAWARETHSINAVQTTIVGGVTTVFGSGEASGSETRFGPMIGFGTEYAFAGNWSFKAEYNYLHFATGSVLIAGSQTFLGVTTPVAQPIDIQQAVHLTKIGLNYRFGPDGAPAIAPSRPAPGYNWTGSYVGVVAGYGFGRKEWPDLTPGSPVDVDGWLAGGTIGTNVQAGVFVLGIESEWMWTGIKGSSNFSLDFGLPVTVGLTNKIDWLSLTSVRVGFVAADRWLVYAKGGVALARESHSLVLSQNLGGGALDSFDLSGKALHTGYLAGIGVEHAFLGNWSAKVEYNYINFRQQDVMLSGTETGIILGGPSASISFATPESVREEIHLVKFGLNYRFNVLDIVTAKY